MNGCFGAAIRVVVATMALAGPRAVVAQAPTEPIADRVRELLTHDGFEVGFLLQAVVDPALDDGDSDPASVQLAAARLLLRGALDSGFEYFIQTNFAAAPSVLDARVGWRASERFGIWAGRFKTPLSREFLVFAGSIDFVNRSRVVAAMAPGRQMGVQVGGQLTEGLDWSVGGFTGVDSSPVNESLVGVARLDLTRSMEPDRTLRVGISGAMGRDGALAPRLLGEGFEGDGSIVEIDGRLESGRLLLAGEVIAAWYDEIGTAESDASGFYLTGGWMTSDRTQALVRWDRFTAPGAEADDNLVLGFNAWPTTASEIQVNWIAPVAGSAAPHKLLVNFQVGIF